jgi:nucleoid-associated protein YgaU
MSAATEFTFAPPVVAVPQRRLTAVPAQPAPARVPERPVATVAELHRPRAVEHAAPLRLTRRGVVVVAALVSALGAGLVWLAAASATTPASSGAARGVQVVTVAPGDTLWSIASRVAPGRDPRAEVAALQRRNHLGGVDLSPGQRLRVR